MIVKELIEQEFDNKRPRYEVVTGPDTPMYRSGACQSCAAPCVSWHSSRPDQTNPSRQRKVKVGIGVGRLHAVVVIVFGLPLAALALTLASLERLGLADQPLLSLAILIFSVAITMKLITAQGSKLLHLLQLRPLISGTWSAGSAFKHLS